jgi:uncharacterized protein YdeI (YjbR/CyaY-like superfamily)
MLTTNVDDYLIDGCMRCELGGTPQCKVRDWKSELIALRSIVLDCGLEEVLKWGVPCYTFQGKNVLIVSALKDSANISFFKGALLSDELNLLLKPGENSQAARYLKFTDLESIVSNEEAIKAYVFEAIEIEKQGLKVTFQRNPEPIPDELQERLDEDPIFRSAFESLTPGRQRGYVIHFSQPKQSKTRIARIDKWLPKILNGEGMHDQYKSMKKK